MWVSVSQGKEVSIVTLSSGAGIVGLRNDTAYSAMEHAVAGLTTAAIVDRIRINVVAPVIP